MSKKASIQWAPKVADRDYAAALAYLTLRWDDERAQQAVERLRDVNVTARRANDLLRASRLDPAALDDPGVLKDLVRVAKGKRLSPILCVALETGLEVADGFHRLSAAYRLDPYGAVALKLA